MCFFITNYKKKTFNPARRLSDRKSFFVNDFANKRLIRRRNKRLRRHATTLVTCATHRSLQGRGNFVR